MKCYFCDNELKAQRESLSYKVWAPCSFCCSNYQLDDVTTSQDEDGSVIYAHIYPDEQKYGTIYSGSNIPGSNINYPSNRTYHIRLNVKENTTDIRQVHSHDQKVILHLPGLTINPSNAREKLKLYLLFS
jgi:hypothetical protein